MRFWYKKTTTKSTTFIPTSSLTPSTDGSTPSALPDDHWLRQWQDDLNAEQDRMARMCGIAPLPRFTFVPERPSPARKSESDREADADSEDVPPPPYEEKHNSAVADSQLVPYEPLDAISEEVMGEDTAQPQSQPPRHQFQRVWETTRIEGDVTKTRTIALTASVRKGKGKHGHQAVGPANAAAQAASTSTALPSVVETAGWSKQ